ncbi:MAG: PilZ domain-containing protein [Mariprofundus sp.]|nr:PilZ domain-containing protein [Mariprofundus sp.]
MSDREKTEKQRGFERFPLDFSVGVTGFSPSNEPFSDHGGMNNISGSGACFMTQHPEWYSVGQELVIHVCLPGTDQLDAGMESSGQVVWVFSGRQEGDEVGLTQIGISMDGCMSFETRKPEQGENPG